ncbi:MAG: hypothetical protein Q9162_007484 [Coniocarpon cinnabarinum]
MSNVRTWASSRVSCLASLWGVARPLCSQRLSKSLSACSAQIKPGHLLKGQSLRISPKIGDAFYTSAADRRGQTVAKIRKSAKSGSGTGAHPVLRALSPADLKNAFGRDVEAKVGNHTLRELQSRRVNGSLVERGVYFENKEINEDGLKRALQWLRKRYPVDESSAAERWASETATELENDYDRRAHELGLARDIGDGTRKPAGDTYSRPGNRSILDDQRLYNEERARKWREHREQTGEAQRSRDLQLAKTSRAERQARERALALAEHRRKQTEAGYVFKGPIPNMTSRQRILPAALFAVVFTAVMVTFSERYRAPAHDQRIWNDLPPTIATLLGMSMVMTLITVAWHVPRCWRIMNTYLLSVPAWPNSLSMFGNIWSHQNFKHLGANLLFLWLYGISLHEEIGRGYFTAIFCAGGVGASFASLSWHVLRGNLNATMSGASGGVAALIFAWIYFNAT